jgi:hypothetical protein
MAFFFPATLGRSLFYDQFHEATRMETPKKAAKPGESI